MTSDWPGLLDAGDPAAARAVWQQRFSADCDSLAATWELAEIEERWGDALFFAGEAGAAPHYQAAWRALMPLGLVFSSWEEGERRTEAYERITVKIRAIDPYGVARIGNVAQAHPNFRAIERPVKPAAEPEPAPAPVPPQSPPPGSTEPADLVRKPEASGHWRHYDLACQWRDTGKEFGAVFPAAARRAFQLSMDHFELYNQAWIAHAPASRWDSDGGQEIVEVQDMMRSLDGVPAGAPLPAWIEAMLAGDWQRALAALGGTVPPPEFSAAARLLSDVSRSAPLGD